MDNNWVLEEMNDAFKRAKFYFASEKLYTHVQICSTFKTWLCFCHKLIHFTMKNPVDKRSLSDKVVRIFFII